MMAKALHPVFRLARQVRSYSPDTASMAAALLQAGLDDPKKKPPTYHAALMVLHHADELKRHSARLLELGQE